MGAEDWCPFFTGINNEGGLGTRLLNTYVNMFHFGACLQLHYSTCVIYVLYTGVKCGINSVEVLFLINVYNATYDKGWAYGSIYHTQLASMNTVCNCIHI